MKALIVVDLQNDFCEGGPLESKNTDSMIVYINALLMSKDYAAVTLTRDWHPLHHQNFAGNQKDIKPFTQVDGKWYWPNHCVQYSKGARFHPDLRWEWAEDAAVFTKGVDPTKHPFSGFAGTRRGQTLNGFLSTNGIKEIDVVGLALDYCVKDTALDGIKNNYITNLLVQGTRATQQSNVDSTLTELREAEVIIHQVNF